MQLTRSWRLDFLHTQSEDRPFELNRIREERAWPGRSWGVGGLDLGEYRVRCLDAQDGSCFYQEGFSTDLGNSGHVEHSIRIPKPAHPAEVLIDWRGSDGSFKNVWNGPVDPADAQIDRSPNRWETNREDIAVNGAPHIRVNLVMLGDGYRHDERDKFRADARRAAAYIFDVEPFRSRRSRFNVFSVFTPSPDSGITDDYLNITNQTVFDTAYYSHGSERRIAPSRHWMLHEAAGAVPYDFVLLLVNARRYGGSGGYRCPAVAAMDSRSARYLVVHELAHTIGGLSDEYYFGRGTAPAFDGEAEPWQPNVTTMMAGAPKWDIGSQVPSRWKKDDYEAYFEGYVNRYLQLRAQRVEENRIDSFIDDELKIAAKILAESEPGPGLFEGARHYASGIFRCEPDCTMFTLRPDRFCRACSDALARAVDHLSQA